MNLEQRLARLEAIEAIRQLKARYFQACDRKDPGAVRECFLPGAIDLRYGRIEDGVLEFRKKPIAAEAPARPREAVAAE